MPVVLPTIQGLTTERVAASRSLCVQMQVQLAVIFGSRAHGQATATSDVDLLVLPSSAVPFDLLGFEAAVQQIVGTPRVDVTLLHPQLNSALAWEALRDAAVLWEETPGSYVRERATWYARFQEDAPRRHEQALQLMHLFRCP
jgi:predicted nucleotidyltransferase